MIGSWRKKIVLKTKPITDTIHVWYIYLHFLNQLNVGKYTMIMDSMGNPLSGAYFIMAVTHGLEEEAKEEKVLEASHQTSSGASGVTHDLN